jgi:sugar phosphate isomerase/epimerase
MLNPSLITSFTAMGFEEALKQWPGKSKTGIELYCFMRKDCPRDALNYLAGLRSDPQARLELVRKFLAVRRRHGITAPVVGLASFLPEISLFGPDSRNRDTAIKAITTLLWLAKHIREEIKNDPTSKLEDYPRVVEIVAGSVIKGIWRGKPTAPDDEEYPIVALVEERELAIERLAEGLAQACEGAGLLESDHLSLALELEPGPLFVLNSLDALKWCHRALEKQGILPFVGFNLDIAHWHLAGIRPSDLENEEELCRQIVHAHISDQSKGHFGDLVIGRVGFEAGGDKLAVFRQWLRFLSSVWARPRPEGAPKKTHFVSVELEVCEDIEAVKESLEILDALLHNR